MRKRVAAVEILAASITIASGGSAGREGPIAQIGAGIASSMAQILRLRPKDIRLLVTSGLVAGISATFNAPIGALIFGLEILSPEIDASRLINLLLASVTGKIVATQFLGDYPAFFIPYTIVFSNIVEILFVALLGVIIGLLGALWVVVFDRFETWVDEVNLPLYMKTGIFGLIVGLIGFQFVEYGILGVGYEAVDSFFMGKITLMSVLFFIAFMKMVATLFTVGSGTTGGIFAPSLVIGTFLGAGLGVLFEKLFPNIISDPNLYALVGMAAYFTAVAKVPLTTLVMIPEMTRSYTIFVPIMVANAISYVMSLVILGRESIYTLKLNRIMRRREFVKI
jgi:CIC family chloride channel protein